MPELTNSVLNEMTREARKRSFAHHKRAAELQMNHYILGIATVAVTAVAAVDFPQLYNGTLEGIPRGVALVSAVFAPIGASLQTFLQLGGRSAEHSKTAADWQARLYELMYMAEQGRTDTLQEATQRVSELRANSPVIPNRIWDRARKWVEDKERESRSNDTTSGGSTSPD